MIRVSLLVLATALAPTIVDAAATTWVHGTDPTCGGNSPCHATLALGIQDVDNGGTVIVMASATDKIIDDYGKQNITVRGINDTITLTGNVNLAVDEPAIGWTLQDINFTLGIVIRTITNSLTIDNVGAAAIKLGDTDQDLSATITIREVTMQQGVGALISIIAVDGADIGGTILIEDCVGIYAININADVMPAEPAFITANITIRRNEVLDGGGINVRGIGVAGSGSILGSIEFSDNVMSDLVGKFGVTLYQQVTGTISGPVTFTNNRGSWLAVLTTSTPAGTIGELTFSGNTAEAIEVVATGAITGPVLVSGNDVIDLGGGTGLDNPLLLLDGSPWSADVDVENNTAPEADIVVRSSTGEFTGTARIENNSAGLITLDSRDGDMTMPFEIIDNTLPSAAVPLSTLTIRTLNGGDVAGGTISGNQADRLTVNFAGSLTGALASTSNTVGEDATYIAVGGPGSGYHTVTGNDFQGFSYFDGMHSQVRFNRVMDRLTVVAGATVDGRYNWWGCNAGVNQTGCSTATTLTFQYYPHLVFDSAITCVPPDLVAEFDLLEAADTTVLPGNITPGSVVVTSTVGTVSGSPAGLANGQGSATITLPQGATQTTISAQLDSQVIDSDWPCSDTVFIDGFESGDTSAWTLMLARICSCLSAPATPTSFSTCVGAAAAPSMSRDLLNSRCDYSVAE